MHGNWNRLVLALAAMMITSSCSEPSDIAAEFKQDFVKTTPENAPQDAPVRILSAELTPEEKAAVAAAQATGEEADAEARRAIKYGIDYVPVDEDSQLLFDRLEKSMVERRSLAWQIVEQMLQPQKLKIGSQNFDVPLWHTWYEGGVLDPADPESEKLNVEIARLIRKYYEAVRTCTEAGNCPPKDDIVDLVMKDGPFKSFTQSATKENLTQTLGQFRIMEDMTPEAQGILSEHLGRGGTIFSPSFVRHLLTQIDEVGACNEPNKRPKASDEPPSDTQFSPCITEFPRSAVMVKTSWESIGDGEDVSKYDTSGAGLEKSLASHLSRWTSNGAAEATKDNMYAVKATNGEIFGLKAIHFSTKDTREWVWVTLWWSPEPEMDFGQDRPTAIGNYNQGVWKNYKMCVTSAFTEADSEPWKAYAEDKPSLASAIRGSYQAISSQKSPAPYDMVTSWCSNPFVEGHPNNNKTNCIGCHQYSMTWNENQNILPNSDKNTALAFFDPLLLPWRQGGIPPLTEEQIAAYDKWYPQMGRARFRKNFPADFSWAMPFEFKRQYKIEQSRGTAE